MKINAEKFLKEINSVNLLENVFLVSGNEPGLIFKTEKKLIDTISKKYGGKADLVEIDPSSEKNLSEGINSISLFSSYNIILVKNPDKKIIDVIESENISNCTIIISDAKIKSSSKIKNYFDIHKTFYSISCYKISSSFKRGVIDLSLNKRKTALPQSTYWFLVENISDDYQVLENELEKISLYDEENLSVKDMSKILSNNNKLELDELFFQSLISTNEGIVKKSNNAIKSSSDAYIFLQILKNYVRILALTSEEKTNMGLDSIVQKHLPKYLFKQKENFKTLIKKASTEKIREINNLNLKAELLLRKNDNQFNIIIQRLILKCGRILR